MATETRGSFQKALENFKSTLSEDQLRDFSICTQNDVYRAVDDIQKQHGPKRTLRNMERMSAFLEAMDHLGKTVEVFLNLHPLVCFIWGPIKFLLGVAQTWHQSLDALLTAYALIGDEMPGLLNYTSVFEKHPTLAAVLEDYFGDVLHFHINAMSVFCRPKWKAIFQSSWKTFNSRFDPILTSIRSRRQLLDSEKASATVAGVDKLREQIEILSENSRKQAQQAELDRHHDRMRQIRNKLKAPDYELDRSISAEESGGGSSGQWLFGCSAYSRWIDTDVEGHEILYINAIPGAGKTVLMTKVINTMLSTKYAARGQSQWNPVLYFYCKYDESDKRSFNSILRALLDQILSQDQALSDDLLESIMKTEPVALRATGTLTELLEKSLGSYDSCFLIIDGLDECSDVQEAIRYFLSLTARQPDESNRGIRVMISAQRDGILDKTLAGRPSISLEASEHLADVRRYCEQRSAAFKEKFHLDEHEVELVIAKVANNAQGMFLFAKVVLNNLISQPTRSQLKIELKDETFPKGLEKAYDRVFLRVFDNAHPAEKECAEKVLNWIVCARRPMRWREMQAVFCIDPEAGDVDYTDRRILVSFKALCGSFIDVHQMTTTSPTYTTDAEAVLMLVHQTARIYLTKTRAFDPNIHNTQIAIYSMQYLVTNQFRRGIRHDEIVQHAKSGYYGLQDYAVSHWFDHLQPLRLQPQILPVSIHNNALRSFAQFLKSYCVISKAKDLQHLETTGAMSETLCNLPLDHFDRNAAIDIEIRVRTIRNAIEAALEGDRADFTRDAFVNLHGDVNLYKCSKPWCDHFSHGFGTAVLRNMHVNRHNLPFCCTVEGCYASEIGFDNVKKLERHELVHKENLNSVIEFPSLGRKSKTPLFKAVKNGDCTLVSSLLESGASPNEGSRVIQDSPIYMAATLGHCDIVKLLLDKDAALTFGPKGYFRKHTVLNAAIEAGNPDIVDLLITTPRFKLDLGGDLYPSPLILAAERGELEIFQMLLLKAESISFFEDPSGMIVYSHSLLPAACRSGNIVLVDYILESFRTGFPDEVRERALSEAAGRGYQNLVDLVLSAGDPQLDLSRAILAALDSSHHSMASTLLSICNYEITGTRMSQILLVACAQGTSDIVYGALSCEGVDVNHKDGDLTPLLAAVQGAHLDVVTALLNSGSIDVTIATWKGVTPFLMALVRWSETIATQTERCVGLLGRLICPSLLRSLSDSSSLVQAMSSAIQLEDYVILQTIKQAAEVEGLKTSWLAAAVRQQRLDLVEDLLLGEDITGDIADSTWENMFAWMSTIDDKQYLGKTLRLATMRYLARGKGISLTSQAVKMGFPEVAKLSVVSELPVALQERRALMEEIVTIDKPELLWTSIESFVSHGLGDTLLWASLLLSPKKFETIKRLVGGGLVDINARLNSLPSHGKDLIQRATNSILYLDVDQSHTPLLFVLQREVHSSERQTTLSKYLLQLDSVDVTLCDSEGTPPIFQTLIPGALGLLATLLKRDHFSPNVVDKNGTSPLTVAAERGNLAAVKLLLQAGCEQESVEAATKIARRRGYLQTLEALETYTTLRITDNY